MYSSTSSLPPCLNISAISAEPSVRSCPFVTFCIIFRIFGCNGDYFSIRLGNNGRVFGNSSFKYFFNTRQAGGDVSTGYASSVEGTQCQLCPRLSDGLRRNNTDSFS